MIHKSNMAFIMRDITLQLEQLVIIDGKSTVIAFDIEANQQLRIAHNFQTNGYVHEASDLAVFQGNYYITDYKTHSIVVYSLDGI